MLGLMATLISLGPGLTALSNGDLGLLAEAMLTAFDTTVIGLAAGAHGLRHRAAASSLVRRSAVAMGAASREARLDSDRASTTRWKTRRRRSSISSTSCSCSSAGSSWRSCRRRGSQAGASALGCKAGAKQVVEKGRELPEMPEGLRGQTGGRRNAAGRSGVQGPEDGQADSRGAVSEEASGCTRCARRFRTRCSKPIVPRRECR